MAKHSMENKNKLLSIQDKILARVGNKNYSKMNASIAHRLIEKGSCKLSDGGRCDSPVHNDIYLT